MKRIIQLVFPVIVAIFKILLSNLKKGSVK